MFICHRVLSVSIGKSSVVEVSAESPPAHASRAYSGHVGGSLLLNAAPAPNLRPCRAPSMPTVGAIARYRLVSPPMGPLRKRRCTTSRLLMPRVCIWVCTVFIGSRSEACTMPATLLAIAARVGSPDSASDDDDTVRLILLPALGTLCPTGVANARRTPPSSASAGLKTAEPLQVAARPISARRLGGPGWGTDL